MSARDVKVVLNVPTIAIPFGQSYLTNITNAINSRGQNQGSKKATLQGNKGLYQQKRINIKNEALFFSTVMGQTVTDITFALT